MPGPFAGRRCLFAHGFEGTPRGRKASFLQQVMGFDVIAPMLSNGGWTPEGQSVLLEEAYDAAPNVDVIIGSSFGALAVLLMAQRKKKQRLKLMLLAPAIGLDAVWRKRIGDGAMVHWAKHGTRPHEHDGLNRRIQLPYEHWQGCKAASHLVTTHPTIFIHGLQDQTIPIENVWRCARNSPGTVGFYVVPDDHRLRHSEAVIEQGLNSLLDSHTEQSGGEPQQPVH